MLNVLLGLADRLFPFFRSEAKASSILSFILYHYEVPARSLLGSFVDFLYPSEPVVVKEMFL